jgi:aryl-alcohol dehydrogenase-like predicted oxidoreductase
MCRRTLGSHGPEVGPIGYGAMGLSWAYGNREGMDADAVINRAIDLGATLIDTADIYGPFHNELLVGHAIEGRRDEITLATKCGLVLADADTREIARDGTPQHIHEAIDGSLRRLGVDHVDLYYLHRPDPEVPIEESVGALKEVVRHDAAPGQVALAWVLAQGEHVVPIPGTKRIPYLEENMAATEVLLTSADLAELDGLPAPVGARY